MVVWKKTDIPDNLSSDSVQRIEKYNTDNIFCIFLGRLRYKISYDHATQTLNVLVVECQVHRCR